MLRAAASAAQEYADLDVAHPPAGGPVRLVLYEHAARLGEPSQVPAISVRAGVKLSTLEGHVMRAPCLSRDGGTGRAWDPADIGRPFGEQSSDSRASWTCPSVRPMSWTEWTFSTGASLSPWPPSP